MKFVENFKGKFQKMKPKWKRFLCGDKLGQEFTLILLIAICSFSLGSAIVMLDQLKNFLVIAGNIDPENITLYAPLVSMQVNIMVLWDFALITILVVYFIGLTAVFYYVKRRMIAVEKKDCEVPAKEEEELVRDKDGLCVCKIPIYDISRNCQRCGGITARSR